MAAVDESVAGHTIELARDDLPGGVTEYQALCSCGFDGRCWNSRDDGGDQLAYDVAFDEGQGHLALVLLDRAHEE